MPETPAKKPAEKSFYGSQELPRIRQSSSASGSALRMGEPRPKSDDSS